MVQFKSDPLLWWKIHADTYLEGNCVYTGDIWERTWTSEIFRDYLKAFPLSVEKVEYFLRNRVRNLSFLEIKTSTICPVSKHPVLFDICLGLPKSERNIMLVHEIIHGFYRYRYGLVSLPHHSEQVVEVEAKRFCKDNVSFMKSTIPYILESIR